MNEEIKGKSTDRGAEQTRFSTARLIYSVPFALSGLGGKAAGTRRKMAALEGLVGSLFVFTPNTSRYAMGKIYQIARSEISTIWQLLRYRKSIDAFISRSISGFLSVPVARIFGISVIRELHADSIEEARILAKSRSQLVLLSVTARLSHLIDRWADIRIFNHPALFRWYAASVQASPSDFVCYNGGKIPGHITADRERRATRVQIGAENCRHLLCFCGSMAPWHGIESLVRLQEAFMRHNDSIRIICAGGRVPDDSDPNRVLLNISPADEAECEMLVQCADLCLLPVQDIRRSPGSPLKLFDYLMMGALIATQKDTEGYSDIVAQYDAGFSTDFNDSEVARREILAFLNEKKADKDRVPVQDLSEISWEARMRHWLSEILPPS